MGVFGNTFGNSLGAKGAVIRRFSNPDAMYVELTFDSAPTFDVSKAPLLYDKKVAFSFRFADGYREGYLNTSAVLLGLNTPDFTGATHPGYRFTDGCGNDVMYTADYSPFMYDEDPRHSETATTYMRWSDFQKAKDFGHGILFHGYDDTSAPDPTVPYEELMDDLISFRNLCYTKWGFKPLMATSPGGELQWYNKDGKAPFFDAGYLMSNILYQPIDSLVAGENYVVPLNTGLNFNNINQEFFSSPQLYPGAYHSTRSIKVPNYEDLPETGNEIYLYITTEPTYAYYRWNSSNSTYEVTSDRPGASESLDEIKQRITNYINNSYSSGFNVTTHNVKYNPDEQFNGGMDVNYFKEFLNWVDTTYGKNGTDQILFMSSSAVLDYLYAREFSSVNTYTQGNKVILEIVPTVFNELRRPALTLKLNSSLPVKSIQINNIDKFSQNVIDSTSGIINLEWGNEHYDIANRYVTYAEEVKTQRSVDMAQFFVNNVSDSSKNNSLQMRLNSIDVLTSVQYLVDFGRFTYIANTPPFNNVSSSDFDISNYLPSEIILRDISNASYGLKLDIVQAFTTMTYSGVVTGDDSGIYPDLAIRDSFNVSPSNPAIIKIHGLQAGQVVDFKFFSSKTTTSGYISRFTVHNSLTSATFNRYVTTDPLDNIDTTADIYNSFANDNGEIFVTISSDNGDSIPLNVLEFTTKDEYVNNSFIIESMLINGGQAETSSLDVSVSAIYTGDPTSYLISEDSQFTNVNWAPYSGGSILFTLSEGNGLKRIYLKFKDNDDRESNVYDNSITVALSSKIVISWSSSTNAAGWTYVEENDETINFVNWNRGETIADWPLKNTEGIIKGYIASKPSEYPTDTTIKTFALSGSGGPVLTGNTGPYKDIYLTRFYYSQSVSTTGNKSLLRFLNFAPGNYMVRILMSTNATISTTNQQKLYYQVGLSGTPAQYASQSANNTTIFTEVSGSVGVDGILDVYFYNTGNLTLYPGFNLIEIIKQV